MKFQWLVCPSAQTDGMTERLVEYVGTERQSEALGLYGEQMTINIDEGKIFCLMNGYGIKI